VSVAPTFSIATPTRNALDKLKRCVGSVRGQSGVRYEHLIQDARSDDGSADWLAAQSSQDALLNVRSEADDGMYDAINRAWSRSRGDYVAWLNADEQYLPGTLARVQAFFETHPDVDVLFADYLVTDEQGRAMALRREIPLRRFYVANSFLNAQSCTLFYRRHLLDKGLLKLDSRLRYAADKDLILRLLAAGIRFQHLPEVLSAFGVDGNNLSTHPQMEREAEAVRLAYGGFAWRPARALAYAGRRVERLLQGAYRSVNLRYRYALDETPHYADYLAENLGGRYALTDACGRARRVDAPDLAAEGLVATGRNHP
jgi:glycosyltransferase involved in cell wall biosynthesis